ncbi:hypothetical protein HAX54_017296 [Datura stramonium]|uniref:F-box protein At3g26010-like beta-propeller domain-containing protein n=1 Tax=Datura stramonium TaxID=4076 RepID=A0ABS8Y6M6_DATST|nr:hypothetical protein [Datura stramonium]
MRDRTNLECVEFLIHANRLSRSTTVDLGFLYADRQPNDRFELVASCGDLILLSSGKNYCICNILTRQWIALPPAPSGRGNFGESIGFMYEPLDDRHNKYLVFRFLPCDWYTDEGDSKFDVEIFSSEEGRWTRSVVRSPQILNCLCSNNPIIACGRMLYTLNYCHGYIYNSVVAFDPFANDPARLIRLIDVPDEARDIPFMDSKLGVCGGRLQFAILIFQHCRQPRIRVWELEDDYRMGNWRMVFVSIVRCWGAAAYIWQNVSSSNAMGGLSSKNSSHAIL